MKIYFSILLLVASVMSNQVFGLVTDSSSIEILLDLTHVDCKGSNSGQASLTVVGGVPPYSYDWSTEETNSHISLLTAGLYSVIVTDSTNCIDTLAFEIFEPEEELSLSLSTSNVKCNGYGGNVLANVSGGTQPYLYKWGGLGSGNLPATSTFGFGNYSVTITDANGCTRSAQTSVSRPCNIVLTADITHVECLEDSTGTISLNISGQCIFTPIQFCLSGGGCFETNEFTNLPAGEYSFLVKAGDCSRMANFTIAATQNSELIVDVTNLDDLINCENGLAQIEIEASGGNPPYDYSWSNGVTTNVLDSLSGGIYTYTVTDSLGCITSGSQNISNTPVDTTMTEKSLVYTCPNNKTPIPLRASINVSHENIDNIWENELGDTLNTETRLLFVDSPGIYKYYLLDKEHGCVYVEIFEVSLNQNYNPEALLASPSVVQISSTVDYGSVDPMISGGETPYDYLWSGNFTEPIRDSLGAGLYRLTVTDNNECLETFSFTIYQFTSNRELVDFEMEIIPNPSDGKFQINNLHKFNPRTINVYHPAGKLIREINLENDNNITIDLSHLASGVYILLLFDDERITSQKIIIAN